MLRAWWEIRKATRAAVNTECYYAKALTELRRGKHSRDDMDRLDQESSQVIYEAWQRRDEIVTKYLLRDARLLDIPVPSRNDEQMWDCDPYFADDTYLSRAGISHIRKAIRDERQARGIYPKILFTAVTSCIAAIGAVLTIAKMVYDWFTGGP